MGIPGLGPFLKKRLGTVGSLVTLSAYRGKVLIFDVAGLMYKFSFVSKKRGGFDVLALFKRQKKTFDLYGIKPIYVLDGNSLAEKEETLAARKRRKQSLEKDIEKLEKEVQEDGKTEQEEDALQERLDSKRAQHIDISPADWERLCAWFEQNKVEYVRARADGEHLCALYSAQGKADACVSDDWDALAFGAKVVLRNFTTQSCKQMQQIRLQEDILDQLELNQSQFVSMCVLCGCDFAKGVLNIGPASALALAKKHDSFEECLRACAVQDTDRLLKAYAIFMQSPDLEESSVHKDSEPCSPTSPKAETCADTE